MKVTYEEVNYILRQLPISYYLKRKTNVELSKEAQVSCIDLFTGNIIISFNQIQSNLETSDHSLEVEVRNKLYHELSHALLSPQPLRLTINKDIYNIFEDERVEVLLNNYYLDVDFKKILIENHSNFKPTDNLSLFFYYVRLRGGGEKINNEINELISKWKYLKYDFKKQDLTAYQKDIDRLYKKIIKERKIIDIKSQEFEEKSNSNLAPLPIILGEGEMETILNSISEKMKSYNDSDFRKRAELIINSKRIARKNDSLAKPSHKGKLNVKRINRANDDFKWFYKKGEGDLNKYSGIKLNLFIDQSGSYLKSEQATNSILKELTNIERKYKDFSFTLTTIDTDIEIKPKYKRCIDCKGGNCLSKKLFTIFNSLQKGSNLIMNLVLLNGDMATDTYNGIEPFSELQYENLKAFNKKNVFIISDNSNKEHLEKYCSRAKKIYTKNYLEEFRRNVLNSLKILINIY